MPRRVAPPQLKDGVVMQGATAKIEPSGMFARARLRSCLGNCSAMDVKEISDKLGIGADSVERELRGMIDSGEVEIIRPLQPCGGAPGRAAEHYRLRRATDGDFRWHQNMSLRLPAGRLFDVLQVEEGNRNSGIGPRQFGAKAQLRPALSV